MNYRIPYSDILTETRVMFYIGNKVPNDNVSLVLIDKYSKKKMVLTMCMGIINTITLPFNESGTYEYYFLFEDDINKFYYGNNGKHVMESKVEPFTITVYKEGYITNFNLGVI